jgi:hypothetical protein
MNGCHEGSRLRDKLEEKMSAEQIAEAKVLKAQWQAKKMSGDA